MRKAEDKITDTILLLRSKHQRPHLRNIFETINKNKSMECDKDEWLDLSLLKEAISNLVASKGIFNGGMEGKESYYINEHSFIPSPGVLDNTSECCTEATHSVTPDAEEINNIF